MEKIINNLIVKLMLFDLINIFILSIIFPLSFCECNLDKPINKNGVCKLTDFGGAKIIKEEMSIYSSMQGTPNWMAPEIIKSLGATRYSDIWSIGCTIIEMFQGKPPYNDKKNAISILNCICKNNEPPKIPEGMSEQLRDFVEKCLVFEPTKRYNVYQLKKHPFLNENASCSNIQSTSNSFY